MVELPAKLKLLKIQTLHEDNLLSRVEIIKYFDSLISEIKDVPPWLCDISLASSDENLKDALYRALESGLDVFHAPSKYCWYKISVLIWASKKSSLDDKEMRRIVEKRLELTDQHLWISLCQKRKNFMPELESAINYSHHSQEIEKLIKEIKSF